MSTLVQFPAALSHQAPLTPEEIARNLHEYESGEHPVAGITRAEFDRRWAALQSDLDRAWDEHRRTRQLRLPNSALRTP